MLLTLAPDQFRLAVLGGGAREFAARNGELQRGQVPARETRLGPTASASAQ
jgi:hypothetical protein